ncbi:hypothetical protein [Streptomyces sp. NPDC001388]|uniref:hypothetical protein n=1 Tax=Streptomyces sp. NPDC001388 TaxID=3364568 RepID=UPI0036963A4C
MANPPSLSLGEVKFLQSVWDKTHGRKKTYGQKGWDGEAVEIGSCWVERHLPWHPDSLKNLLSLGFISVTSNPNSGPTDDRLVLLTPEGRQHIESLLPSLPALTWEDDYSSGVEEDEDEEPDAANPRGPVHIINIYNSHGFVAGSQSHFQQHNSE